MKQHSIKAGGVFFSLVLLCLCSVEADGQTAAADGFTWYRLTTGEWVRADLVTAAAECASLGSVSP